MKQKMLKVYLSQTGSYQTALGVSGSEGAKNLKARFENMAKSGEEEGKKRAEEERARREAREKREQEEQKKQVEVGAAELPPFR